MQAATPLLFVTDMYRLETVQYAAMKVLTRLVGGKLYSNNSTVRTTCDCFHRARLKQRLEAAQEGVSTEDGSSSVTSGLDEDQAAQADMMMRRLVWVCATVALHQAIPPV